MNLDKYRVDYGYDNSMLGVSTDSVVEDGVAGRFFWGVAGNSDYSVNSSSILDPTFYNAYFSGGLGDDTYKLTSKQVMTAYESSKYQGQDTLVMSDYDDLKTFSVNGRDLVVFSESQQAQITIVNGMTEDNGFDLVEIWSARGLGSKDFYSFSAFFDSVEFIGDFSTEEAANMGVVVPEELKQTPEESQDLINELVERTDKIAELENGILSTPFKFDDVRDYLDAYFDHPEKLNLIENKLLFKMAADLPASFDYGIATNSADQFSSTGAEQLGNGSQGYLLMALDGDDIIRPISLEIPDYNAYVAGGAGSDHYTPGQITTTIYEAFGDEGVDTLTLNNADDWSSYSIDNTHLVLFSESSHQEVTLINGMSNNGGIEQLILTDGSDNGGQLLTVSEFLSSTLQHGDFTLAESLDLGIDVPADYSLTLDQRQGAMTAVQEMPGIVSHINSVLEPAGLSFEEAQSFIYNNVEQPDVIYNEANTVNLTSEMLGQIVGVSTDIVDNYFASNGLDPAALG